MLDNCICSHYKNAQIIRICSQEGTLRNLLFILLNQGRVHLSDIRQKMIFQSRFSERRLHFLIVIHLKMNKLKIDQSRHKTRNGSICVHVSTTIQYAWVSHRNWTIVHMRLPTASGDPGSIHSCSPCEKCSSKPQSSDDFEPGLPGYRLWAHLHLFFPSPTLLMNLRLLTSL